MRMLTSQNGLRWLMPLVMALMLGGTVTSFADEAAPAADAVAEETEAVEVTEAAAPEYYEKKKPTM